MHSSRLIGALVVAAIALTAVGGLAILVTQTLTSGFVIAAAVVIALVVLLVGATTAIGRTGGGSRETPYW